MTTDLGQLFRAAKERSDDWTEEDVRRALERLSGGHLEIDWEPGDEQWGRVIDTDGEVHGLVCATVPVGASRADMSPDRLSAEVTWFSFESMTDRAYHIDVALLESIFGRPLTTDVDYSSLSVGDLWFATIS